jgi:hypothetical protein
MHNKERSPIYETRATRVLHFDDRPRPRRRGRLVALGAALLALIAAGALLGQGLRVAAQQTETTAAGSRPGAPHERVLEALAEAAVPSRAPTAVPTTAPPARPLTVSGTEGTGLRLRPTPGLAGEIIAVLPEGSAVEPTGATRTADGLSWAEVRADGLTGWTATDYLR